MPTSHAGELVNRTRHVVDGDEGSGLRFVVDPAFFVHDLTAHNASSLLASAALPSLLA